MEPFKGVPFKIYIYEEGSDKPSVRRFNSYSAIGTFSEVLEKIISVCPDLKGKSFKVYWKDNENDDVEISTEPEFSIFLSHTKGEMKKLYVKPLISREKKHESMHSKRIHKGVQCDECCGNVPGFRYKCLVCKDYDLCIDCERAGKHPEHPMIRLADPVFAGLINFRRFAQCMHLFGHESKSRRRHSHDEGHGDSSRKKKRSDKRETGSDTEEESEGAQHHKKHSHKRSRKSEKCPYSYLMGDMFGYIHPSHSSSKHSHSDGKRETGHHPEGMAPFANLQSLGSTIQKLLEPLGVNVDFQVYPKEGGDNKKDETKNKDTEEPKTPEAEAHMAKTSEEKLEQKKSDTSKASTSSRVHFEPRETINLVHQINEITTKLANQTMNSVNNAENEDWVSYEELNKDSEEPLLKMSEESSPERKPSTEPQKTESNESASGSSRTLYPNLGSGLPDHVKEALDKMVAMGFSDEGNGLTYLLKAKDGDISQVIEILSALKKN